MLRSIGLGLSKNTVLVILIILISLFHLTPLLYENYKAVIIGLWLIVIWFYISTSTKRASVETKKMLYWGGGYIVLGLVYSLFGISSGKIVSDMLFSLFVFPIMFLVLMDSKLTKYNAKLLFHVIAFIAAANLLDNIRLSNIYPYIALMSEEMLEEQGLTGLNVGGAPFIAMAVFYLTIVLIAYFSSTKKTEKYLLLIYAGIALWFIVFCSYKASNTIYALLIVAIMPLLNKVKKIGTATIVLGVFALILMVFIDPIIHSVVDAIGDYRVGSRLLVFAEEDSGYANDNSINSRMDLWAVSLRTWLDNPINFFFGIGEHNRHEFLNTAASGIGNHSDFFDILAKYGIIGGVILYNILKGLFEYSKKMVSGSLYLKVILFMALVVVFGLTKKIILPSISIMLFVFFPLCLFNLNSAAL